MIPEALYAGLTLLAIPCFIWYVMDVSDSNVKNWCCNPEDYSPAELKILKDGKGEKICNN